MNLDNKNLLIIGAGGHGRVAADMARLCGYNVSFLDDRHLPGLPIIGTVMDYKNYISEASFFVAIGCDETRYRILSELFFASAKVITLIHPKAAVAADAQIGPGSIVMAGAVINSGARIGTGVIVNTCSSIDHDCNIGDYVHVSVGCHIAGTVTIGERTFVGAGSTIINNLSICGNCVIGAGATVVRDIDTPDTYMGVPAKRIKYTN